MNRYREDQPYKFSPPRYSGFWAPVIYAVSDTLYLRGKHKVVDVRLSGADEVAAMHRRGDSLLITPNHSDHSDPHTMLHWARQGRVPLHFMAAREVFQALRGLKGRVLQRAGVFSIDREASDLKSIKEAMRIVADGEYPLCMFPEGEIYHLNEQLTPLNDGAAIIMLRTAKKLRKAKSDKRVAIIPTAIRYTYLDDVSVTFREAMDRLERYIRWAPQSHLSVVDRIYKFGEAVLLLKEKEYLDTTLDGDLPARLHRFREIMVSEVETKHFGKVGEGAHPERIRRLRGKIRSILLADESPTPTALREIHRDLDRIYFAIQLYSYPGQYLRENPSRDRVAETILKFEEDFFRTYRVKGRRRAEITFCQPVDMSDFMEQFDKDSKAATREVTTRLSAAIQSVLERRGD